MDKYKIVSDSHSETGGVKPMTIAGRMVHERERLFGMTEGERAWRAQWIKDQVLADGEPIVPKNWYKERYNVIRRIYRFPMDQVEATFRKLMSPHAALVTRHVISKSLIGIFAAYSAFYYYKYNKFTWMSKSGWRVAMGRPAMFPTDPNWPNYESKVKGNQFAVHGFEKSPI